MALSDYSTTASSNGNVLTGIDIAEGCLPSNLNNAQRQVMADLATDLARANGSQDGLATGVSFALPRGLIAMWSGSLLSIPAGWALCDGTNGTPDLQDRFVVATGTTYATIGETGGQDSFTLSEPNIPSHTHSSGSLAGGTNSTGGHTHGYSMFKASVYSVSGKLESTDTAQRGLIDSTSPYWNIVDPETTGSAGTHSHTVNVTSGVTGAYGQTTPTAIDNRPRYYALAFIMKL